MKIENILLEIIKMSCIKKLIRFSIEKRIFAIFDRDHLYKISLTYKVQLYENKDLFGIWTEGSRHVDYETIIAKDLDEVNKYLLAFKNVKCTKCGRVEKCEDKEGLDLLKHLK